MAMISRKKIDELIQTADIVDVISDYVSLQPSGKSMKGLCPFHSEKTPSFHVSKEKQVFNCFGCHKKGNVISFIEEYKHLGFVDAVRFLADRYHVDLGEETDQGVSPYNFDKLYEMNKLAKDFYNLNLLNLESGQVALDYLKSRQIDEQTLNQFDIGYAPAKHNLLLKNLKEHFQEYELVEAGLILRNDAGNYYDVFRDRIIFPIRNEQGKVLGFSGRLLEDSPNKPKYINTQSTKVFNKGTILYNLDQALPFINQRKRLVLMEGFFDVIQATMAGVEESVCTMGTELTLDQVKKIKKYTDDVVICYDGDEAGKQATYRALQMLEKGRLNVQIALMPDGLDPDDYIKQHSQTKFRNQLTQQLMDKYDFVYEMIIEKGLDTSSKIEAAKQSLFKFLITSASQTITSIYLQKFAQKIGLNEETIQQDYHMFMVNQRKFQTIEKQRKKVKINPVSKAREMAEKKIINYYLQEDNFREIIEDEFDNYEFLKGLRYEIFIAMRELYHSQREVALYNLKSDLTDQAYMMLKDMLLKETYLYSETELKDLIDTLILETLNDDIQYLSQEILRLMKQKLYDDYPEYKEKLDFKRKSFEKVKKRRLNRKPSVE